MTATAVHNAIRVRWGTEVEDAQSLPTQYDNAPFTPPQNAKWARFWIRTADTDQTALPTSTVALFRSVGVAIGQLFVPLEDGMDDALSIADAAVSAFRRTTASSVTYRSPTVQVVGRDEGYWQVNVTIPWYSDELA